MDPFVSEIELRVTTNAQSSIEAAHSYLSLREMVEQAIEREFTNLPDLVRRALLISFVLKSQGNTCCIADMFPGPSVSDRTRLLCMRLMAQKGLLESTEYSCDAKSEVKISGFAHETLLNILNITVRNSELIA